MRVLFELIGAWIRGYRDEMTLDQKKGHTDTIKFRLGSWLPPETGYFGMISGDHLTGDDGNPHRAEKVSIGFKWDEIPGYEHLGRFPMIQFRSQLRLDTNQDATDTPILTLCSQGVFFHKAVFGGPGGGGFPTRFALRASNGKYLCADQQFANAPVLANRDGVGPWEVFEVIPQ